MKQGSIWLTSLFLAFVLGWTGSSLYQSHNKNTEQSQKLLSKRAQPVATKNPPQNFPPMPDPDSIKVEQGISQEVAREMLLQEGIVLPPDMPDSQTQDNNKPSSIPDVQAEINLVAEMEAHTQLVKEMKAAGNWPPKPAENKPVELPSDDWMQTNRLVEEQMRIRY